MQGEKNVISQDTAEGLDCVHSHGSLRRQSAIKESWREIYRRGHDLCPGPPLNKPNVCLSGAKTIQPVLVSRWLETSGQIKIKEDIARITRKDEHKHRTESVIGVVKPCTYRQIHEKYFSTSMCTLKYAFFPPKSDMTNVWFVSQHDHWYCSCGPLFLHFAQNLEYQHSRWEKFRGASSSQHKWPIRAG